MSNFKTVVIGASPNPARYSYKAVSKLKEHGYPVAAVGIREGNISGINIETGQPEITDVHTVSLYLSPDKQAGIMAYLLSLNPERIIFNPGTENEAMESYIREKGINAVENCTLVLLATGQYESL